MSAAQMYPKVSEGGLLGSQYTKTSKVLTTAALSLSLSLYQHSSWLIFSLGKSIIFMSHLQHIAKLGTI